ncbi:hypothetical protein [Bradyrhizobium sp. USDA 4452]
MTKISTPAVVDRIAPSSAPAASDGGQFVLDATSPFGRANRYTLSLFSGAREMLLDEMLFASKEFFERIVAETTIFNELLAKLAEAHAVRDYATMYRERAQHQLDFVRRDMDRILKHGQRGVRDRAGRYGLVRKARGAQRAHKCQANARHEIKRGDQRLNVRVGRGWDRYCMDCARRIVEGSLGLG